MAHKLLQRQMRRYCKDESQQPPNLLRAISDAYEQHEQELKILERSLFVTSQELNERNTLLKQQLEELSVTKTRLQRSLATLSATFDATGEVILVFDTHSRLVQSNEMGQRFLASELQGRSISWEAFCEILLYPELLHSINRSLAADPYQQLNGVFELSNGRFMEYHSAPQLNNNEWIGRVWCLRDVTEQKRNEALIEHQAYHDALTGLPNRTLLLDRIAHATDLCSRDQTGLAVLFIDLDNFKKVNDSEGHQQGDMLLKEVATRLQSCLSAQDTLSRLGGDEFIILLEGIVSDSDVTHKAQRLLETLGTPFEVRERQHFLTSSIGISLYPQDDTEAGSLLRKADMAMYRAKELGKNNFQFYSDALEQAALQMLEMERQLRQAIDNNELVLYLQPEVNIAEQRVTAVEALVRWIKPDGTLVPPDQFIPLAEQAGLIGRIGSVVLEIACRQLQQWQYKGLGDVTIAVNLSPIEFHDIALVERIRQLLTDYQIPGKNLVLEITESLFLEKTHEVEDIMHALSELGIGFALDDFGTGYSSFGCLQRWPIQYLKIDRSFLNNVTQEEQKAAIAHSIIDVGNNLGLQVIAEGIEDQATLDFVRDHGCALAQGYYLYRPMPCDQATQMILASREN